MGQSSKQVLKKPTVSKYSAVSEKSSLSQILEDEKEGKISSKRFQLGGYFSLAGGGIEYEKTESNVAGARFRAEARYHFLKGLSTQVDMGLSLMTERGQYDYGYDYFESGVSLYNATLDWKPVSVIEISAGAIKQSRAVPSDLLIQGSASFPGAVEKLQFGNPYISLEIVAEQAIPSSRSFDSERREKEKVPHFFTEHVAVNMTPNEHVQIKPYIGRYEFSQLPSKVAFEGASRGNSVNESFASSAELQYDFAGLIWGGQVLLRLNDSFNITSFYDEIKNEKAPSAFNLGRELGVRSEIRTGAVVWMPEFKTYFNESDSSPAYYNSADRGHNNREGNMVGLKLSFPKQFFSIGAEHYDNKLINPSSLQSDGRVYIIYVETAHVEF